MQLLLEILWNSKHMPTNLIQEYKFLNPIALWTESFTEQQCLHLILSLHYDIGQNFLLKFHFLKNHCGYSLTMKLTYIMKYIFHFKEWSGHWKKQWNWDEVNTSVFWWNDATELRFLLDNNKQVTKLWFIHSFNKYWLLTHCKVLYMLVSKAAQGLNSDPWELTWYEKR